MVWTRSGPMVLTIKQVFSRTGGGAKPAKSIPPPRLLPPL